MVPAVNRRASGPGVTPGLVVSPAPVMEEPCGAPGPSPPAIEESRGALRPSPPYPCGSTIARGPAINRRGEPRARGAPRASRRRAASGLRRMWPHPAALPLTRGRSRALLAMCPPPSGWGRAGVSSTWGYPTGSPPRHEECTGRPPPMRGTPHRGPRNVGIPHRAPAVAGVRGRSSEVFRSSDYSGRPAGYSPQSGQASRGLPGMRQACGVQLERRHKPAPQSPSGMTATRGGQSHSAKSQEQNTTTCNSK